MKMAQDKVKEAFSELKEVLESIHDVYDDRIEAKETDLIVC